MAMKHDPARGGSAGAKEEARVGRRSHTTADNIEYSASVGVEERLGRPAEETAHADMGAHPATVDGSEDRARIVPPPNQGDSDDVTEHLGPESGGTVY